MALSKVKIGSFVEKYSEKCGIPNLTVNDVSGINRDKEFFEPSKQVGADTTNYKIVPPNYFACNLMHVGRDKVLPISMNHTQKNKVVSPAYTVFYITDETLILKEYFFMCLKSEEKDRFFWFNTDSSIRDGMDWEVFCNVEIEIPPVDVQRKYVAVYKAMLHNAAVYQSKVEDLKLTCDAYIEELRRKLPTHPIGDFVEQYKEKNTDGKITLEQGINIEKQFITPQRSNADFLGRKIVRKGQIAYCTQLNNENVAVAYRTGEDCIVSAVYDVIEITRKEEILPEYLMLWLSRYEFGRFVYWASQGTSYEFLSYENLSNYRIPVPAIEVQKQIVQIYNSYNSRKLIFERLKAKIDKMCPILVCGAIKEGGRT